MLAFGVVFVLLLGEIDLSIAYLSGIAGLVAAELQQPDSGHYLPGIWPIVIALAVAAADRRVPGLVRRLDRRAGVRRHARRPARVAGRHPGRIGSGGPIIIQNRWINYTESYFFSKNAGWLIAGLLSVAYVGGTAASVISQRRHGVTIRYPYFVAAKLIAVPAVAFLVVAICNKDRGLPLAGLEIIFFLLFWTFVAKRTTFGRHVYAVGGNAEAARRARHQRRADPDPRLHDLRPDGGRGRHRARGERPLRRTGQGGGTLLLDAISAAVIGGTSLFGGRGNIRSAVLGAAVIATIANGLFIFQFSPGVIFITTGCILLFAVTLDTIARQRQAKTGR